MSNVLDNIEYSTSPYVETVVNNKPIYHTYRRSCKAQLKVGVGLFAHIDEISEATSLARINATLRLRLYRIFYGKFESILRELEYTCMSSATTLHHREIEEAFAKMFKELDDLKLGNYAQNERNKL